jgi:hypothetical protein
MGLSTLFRLSWTITSESPEQRRVTSCVISMGPRSMPLSFPIEVCDQYRIIYARRYQGEVWRGADPSSGQRSPVSGAKLRKPAFSLATGDEGGDARAAAGL